MPWEDRSIMSQRREFVLAATQEDANISALCAQHHISRTTGYTWLRRFREQGPAGLTEHSRRPRSSPHQTPAEMEAVVVALRHNHPAWGGTKLRSRLLATGLSGVPSASTITAILERHGLLNPERGAGQAAWQRFTADAPNDLWQLDFCGHVPLETRGRVHPLALIDDHSRFALAVVACPNEQKTTVQTALELAFASYGLPRRILTDNGPPWGTSGNGGLTALEAWLLQLGISVSHGRPYHPQTQGKVERFHQTLRAEALRWRHFPTLETCQQAFDRWRTVYNLERPHHALQLAVPGSRYQPSPRQLPDQLPAIVYGPDDNVRLVNTQGVISFQNRRLWVSRALQGLPVAVRPTLTPGLYTVYFCTQQVAELDLRYTD